MNCMEATSSTKKFEELSKVFQHPIKYSDNQNQNSNSHHDNVMDQNSKQVFAGSDNISQETANCANPSSDPQIPTASVHNSCDLGLPVPSAPMAAPGSDIASLGTTSVQNLHPNGQFDKQRTSRATQYPTLVTMLCRKPYKNMAGACDPRKAAKLTPDINLSLPLLTPDVIQHIESLPTQDAKAEPAYGYQPLAMISNAGATFYSLPNYKQQYDYGCPRGFPAPTKPNYGDPQGFPAPTKPNYGGPQGFPAPTKPNYGGPQGFPAPTKPNYGGPQGFPAPTKPNYGGPQGFPAPTKPNSGGPQGFPAPTKPNYGGPQGFPAPTMPNYGGPQGFLPPTMQNYGGPQGFPAPTMPNERPLQAQFPLASLAILRPASSDPTKASLQQISKPDVKHTRAVSKPIPTEVKDAKYYQRRKLNNLAAKRSRDLRKQRMEGLLISTCKLQKEQASLDDEERAKTQTVRDLCILLNEDPEDMFRKALAWAENAVKQQSAHKK